MKRVAIVLFSIFVIVCGFVIYNHLSGEQRTGPEGSTPSGFQNSDLKKDKEKDKEKDKSGKKKKNKN